MSKLNLSTRRTTTWRCIVLSMLCLGLIALAPHFGASSLSSTIIDDSVRESIFWNIRIPRVIFGFLTGAALGIAGLVFQSLFRNPLATPYTLGVASGASFGASLAIHLGMLGTFLGFGITNLFGLAGALLATVLVYGLSHQKKHLGTTTMLLAGVAISFFFSSLILFIQYLSDFTQSFRVIRWLMGGLEIVGLSTTWQILPFVIIGTCLIALHARELDLLSVGEEIAISKGLDASRIKVLLYCTVSLMVGAVVSISGPIGFVGMMVPHICRLLLGVKHTLLIPMSFIVGGAFLVTCDTVARTIISPAEIPVGVITALLGGPFFIFILLRQKNGNIQR